MQGPTTEAVGRLQTGHHLPISFQLSASFILLRSHRLPSGIHPVAVLHSQASWKALIIHPLRFPLSCLTSHVLRVQTANDMAHHGEPSHSIRIPPSEEYTRNQQIRLCPFLILFFCYNSNRKTNKYFTEFDFIYHLFHCLDVILLL